MNCVSNEYVARLAPFNTHIQLINMREDSFIKLYLS